MTMRFVHQQLRVLILVWLASTFQSSRALPAEPAPAKSTHIQPIWLGIQTRQTDAGLIVMAVLPFSPAARAGLRSGDRILQINGQRTAGLLLDESSELLGGDEQVLALTIASAGVPLREVRLSRGPLIRPLDDSGPSLRDFIAREVRFAAKVAGLTPAEFDALLRDTELRVQSQGLRLSIEQRGFARQFFLDLHGLKEHREQDPPAKIVQRLMGPSLKNISPAAWQKVDAERQLLASRRKEADVLAQIAAFDEALLLSRDQREKLRQLLAARWTDVWRGHAIDRAATDPVVLCQTALGAMDMFTIPDVDLQAILRPSQIATFKLVQLPTREVAVFIQDGPPPARRLVRRGLPIAEERLRLKLWLERLVDDAAAHADLDTDKKQRLLAAGKLDLEAHFSATFVMEERAADARLIVVPAQQIAGVRAGVPPIFANDDSAFQRVFRKRLSPDEREKIAKADRERGRVHRQAVLQLLTAGLAERALLTDDQAGQLQKLLADQFASADAPDDLAGWRQATLKELLDLRPDVLETVLDDWQRPAAGEYLGEIADSAIAQDVLGTP